LAAIHPIHPLHPIYLPAKILPSQQTLPGDLGRGGGSPAHWRVRAEPTHFLQADKWDEGDE
jgi:hypothetical protein